MAARGRAASPIRPGFIVKSVLSGQLPLETGELVSEAAVTDLHGAYKEMLRRENALRPKVKRIRGMTYRSFITFFKFAQLLGLVEKVREEPMQYPPPGGNLYRAERVAGVMVVAISTRKIFKLSGVGAEDERSWSDLRRAWQEHWTAPQKLEVPVVVKPPPKKPPKVIPVPTVIPVYEWAPRPTPRRFASFLRHLEQLATIGIEDKEVIGQVDRFSEQIGDWEIEVEDMLADAKIIANKPAIARLEEWTKLLTAVREGLIDRDLEKAIEGLRGLTA